MPLSRRKRIVVISAVAVLGAAGLGVGSAYAASALRHGGSKAHASAGRDSARVSSVDSPGRADQPAPAGVTGSASTDPSAVPAVPATPTVTPPAATPTRTATPRRTPTTGVTTNAPTTKPTAAPTSAAPPQRPSSNQAAIQGVFAQLNQLRSTNSLPPLALSDGLLASTHAHTLLMINGCGLSHQCPGEAPLGDRISAQGVTWTTSGENIGEGGPIDATDAAITAAAEGQTTGMYNEQAPNDGHRQNILGAGYAHVGIDVVIDANGIVWMTQDFTT